MRLAPSLLRSVAALGLAAGLLGASSSRADIVISPFTADQDVLIFGPPAGVRTEFDVSSAPGSLGGFRKIILNRLGPSDTRGLVSADSNITAPGFFSYGSGGGVFGSAELQFDGGSAGPAIDPTGLGGVDLTEGGLNTGFLIRGISDLGAPLTITAYTDGDNYSQVTALIPADESFVTQDIFIPFADFAAIAGGGVDFANLGALSFLIDGSNVASLDVRVDFIVATVPEPASLALCGLGLAAGTVFAVRRRRAAQP